MCESQSSSDHVDWFSDGSSVVFAEENEPTDCVALTGDADSGLSNVKAAIRVLISCHDLYVSTEAGRIPIAKHYISNPTLSDETRSAWENVFDQWRSALDGNIEFCDEPSNLGDEAFDLKGYRESLATRVSRLITRFKSIVAELEDSPPLASKRKRSHRRSASGSSASSGSSGFLEVPESSSPKKRKN